jgi:hypothetical protein
VTNEVVVGEKRSRDLWVAGRPVILDIHGQRLTTERPRKVKIISSSEWQIL